MDRVLTAESAKCLACKACEIACAIAHSTSHDLAGALGEDPRPAPRVHVLPVEGAAIALQCQHCDDAPCVAVCPSGALARDEEGAVVLDSRRCIGCKACVVVCTFGSISVSREGALIKCDLCLERRKHGEEPACVVACPTGAVRLLRAAELAAEKRQGAAVRLLAAQTSGRD